MKEAWFYKKKEDSKIRCYLCPHNCCVASGKRGICGVRENRDGTFYSLIYGKIVNCHVDPIEKKPLFHFLPGSSSYSIATLGCNLSCHNCQNWEISQLDSTSIWGEEMNPKRIVHDAEKTNSTSISYTYTEPTIFFEFAYDCSQLASLRGLRNIFVTNGYINPEPLRKISPFLDAANVDLKSMREETYRNIFGGRLAPVKETIKAMRELNIWVEVTTLLIPHLNDSTEELNNIAEFIKSVGEDIPWHVSAFYPNYKMLKVPSTPLSTLKKARDIGFKEGLRYVYTGNIPGDEGENTYCYSCGNLLIKRYGFVVTGNLIKENKCPNCKSKIDGIFS